MKPIVQKSILFAATFMTVCTTAMATKTISDSAVIDGVSTQAESLGKKVVELLSYLLLIIGAVLVTIQSIKFARKDPQASDAYMALGIGLLAGFGLLQVIKDLL